MADELDKLATGVAADHQEAKRQRAKKGQAEPAAEQVEGAGELREAMASFGGAVDTAEQNSERAMELMVDRITAIATDAAFGKGTIAGDLRDTMLDIVKANPKPWSLLGEDLQKQVASAIQTAAQTAVRRIVLLVAEADAEGDTIHAKLDSYSEKGGLKISLTAAGDTATVVALHLSVGQNVIIKRADPNAFNGQRGEPHIDPDQPGLAFEGGDANDRADDDLPGVEE